MKSPFRNHNDGTSLVELMIGVGLLSIVGAAATTFFTRVNTADALARAQAKASSEASGFVSVIERDFKMRDISAVAASGKGICGGTGNEKCQDFTISRKVLVGGSYTDMKIRYTNVCVADSQEGFKSGKPWAFEQSNFNKVSTPPPSCFGRVKCPSGQRNVLQIIPESTTGMPNYPQYVAAQKKVIFPNFDSGKTSYRLGIIGAAICADSNATDRADKIIVETAYVNAEGQLKVEKRDVSIPRGNVAKIQLLPQN